MKKFKNVLRSIVIVAILLTSISATEKNVEQNQQLKTVDVNEDGTAGVSAAFSNILEDALENTAVADVEEHETDLVASSYEDEAVEAAAVETAPIISYQWNPVEGTRYVSVRALNLRADASTDSDILAVLSGGEEIQLVGCKDVYTDGELSESWCRVQVGETTGYVSSEYLTLENPWIDMGSYKITYYCPCEICCGWNTGITASGAMATAGITIAADPSIPFGTEVMIDGHVYTVQDRGGAIKGNHIDIFCNNHSEALSNSVHNTEVYIKR